MHVCMYPSATKPWKLINPINSKPLKPEIPVCCKASKLSVGPEASYGHIINPNTSTPLPKEPFWNFCAQYFHDKDVNQDTLPDLSVKAARLYVRDCLDKGSPP